jgi:hypothetical protein
MHDSDSDKLEFLEDNEKFSYLFNEIKEGLFKEFDEPNLEGEYIQKLSSAKQEFEGWLTNVGLAVLGFFVTSLIQIKLRGEVTIFEAILSSASLFFLLVSIGFYSKITAYIFKTGNMVLSNKDLVGYFLGLSVTRLLMRLHADGINPKDYFDNLFEIQQDTLMSSSEFLGQSPEDCVKSGDVNSSDYKAKLSELTRTFRELFDSWLPSGNSNSKGYSAYLVYRFMISFLGILLQSFSLLIGIFVAVIFMLSFVLGATSLLFGILCALLVLAFVVSTFILAKGLFWR